MADKPSTSDPTGKAAEAADAPSGAPETASEPAFEDRYADVVHHWVYGHLAGGPIAHNTAAWNALQGALPALLEALRKGG